MDVRADPLILLSRALEQTGNVIGAITEEQRSLPTPCAAWNVGDLVSHLVHDLEQFARVARGRSPDWNAIGPSMDAGDDLSSAYAPRAESLLTAWRASAEDPATVLDTEPGAMPPDSRVQQQIAELAVHGWDLATATGRSTRTLDGEVAESALAWARQALKPAYRGDEASGKGFGPEVSVSADAPVYDRLAAFFGRQPHP